MNVAGAVEAREVKDEHVSGLEGQYANSFQIGYRLYEVVFDFGQVDTEKDAVRWHARIIMSPLYAKDLCKTLAEALRLYEEEHGLIPDDDVEESEG